MMISRRLRIVAAVLVIGFAAMLSGTSAPPAASRADILGATGPDDEQQAYCVNLCVHDGNPFPYCVALCRKILAPPDPTPVE